MTNDLRGNRKCRKCTHFGFCLIYWGKECKRQGGSRTPRIKSMKGEPKGENTAGAEGKSMKKQVSIHQPIRTRVVNW